MSDVTTKLQRMARILEVTNELTSTVALEPLLHRIVHEAADLTETQSASILLLDAATQELRFRAASGSSSGRLSDIPVPVESSIAGRVLIAKEPLIVADVRQEPTYYRTVAEKSGIEVSSVMGVPLKIKERCIGVLEAINKRGSASFSQEDVETLSALAAQAAVAIENARLVTALRDAYDELEKLDRMKSDFIAIASHELRSPLGLILGYASNLQEDVSEDARKQLDVIVRAATRLRTIMETMLNLRYLEHGEIALSATRFDLRAEVQDVSELYRSVAETSDLELEVDLPDDEVLIWADRERLHVVLENLMSNAVKFNSPGGLVKVTVTKGQKRVRIRVSDSGVGIAPEHVERVFDRFYQVEDPMSRRHGGIGLGLAIVKELVRLHRGRIWVESQPDQGSTFYVELPLHHDTILEAPDG
jgi:signal transduction histidine kinase